MQVKIIREATYQETYFVDVPDGMEDDEAIDYAWEHYDDGEAYSVEFVEYNDYSEQEVIRPKRFSIKYSIPNGEVRTKEVISTGGIACAVQELYLSESFSALVINYTEEDL